jgi:hypothetical protein
MAIPFTEEELMRLMDLLRPCDKCAVKDLTDCDVCKWDKVRRWPLLRSMFKKKGD